MAGPTFSVVCVFDDPRIRSAWLDRSLDAQASAEVERIYLDNTAGRYESAAAALNAGGQRASGDYYLFVHQDLRLLGTGWFDRLRSLLGDLPDLGIGGVSGWVAGRPRRAAGRNCTYHGLSPEELGVDLPPDVPTPWDDPEPAIEDSRERRRIHDRLPHPEVVRPWVFGTPIDRPTPAQTLDEQLLIVPASVFDAHRFDERLCPGWDLYGTEYALRMRYRAGLTPYVLPLPVWHRSTGDGTGSAYYETLHRVVRAYADIEDLSYLNTPCESLPPDPRVSGVYRYRPVRLLAHVPTFLRETLGRWRRH